MDKFNRKSIKSTNLQESDSKKYLVTTSEGKKYLASLTDDEKSELVGKGAHVEDPATGADNSSSIVSEDRVEGGDFKNLAIQLGKAVGEALRDHGDELAGLTAKDISDSGCTIHVSYKPDEEGGTWEDNFRFEFGQGKVVLNTGKAKIDVCEMTQLSGTYNISKDLVKNVISNVLSNNGVATTDGSSGKPEGSAGEMNEDLLLGFKKAVNTYKQNKNKESVKEIVKAARKFNGDNIQSKLKNAMEEYKMSIQAIQDEEPVESPSDPRVPSNIPCEQCDGDENICLNMSLFIRLLEFAKEDAKEDVDLHWIAQNIQDVCDQKGCATMEDYEAIILQSSKKNSQQEDDDKD